MKIRQLLTTFFAVAILAILLTPNAYADTTRVDVKEDTSFVEANPDLTNYGAFPHLIIGHHNGEYCAKISFEDINLPPETMFDSAKLNIRILDYTYNDSTRLKIGPNVASPTLDENTSTWNTGPAISTANAALISQPVIDLTDELQSLDISNIVNAWLMGTIPNNGIGICVASGQPDVVFTISSKDTTINRLNMSLTYHTVALGDPVMDDTASDYPITFDLVSPDGDTLTTAPYTFRWTAVNNTDPAREHLTITINRENPDSTQTQIIKYDMPTTWTSFQYTHNLADGDYSWYMEGFHMDTLVHTTDTKSFTIDNSTTPAVTSSPTLGTSPTKEPTITPENTPAVSGTATPTDEINQTDTPENSPTTSNTASFDFQNMNPIWLLILLLSLIVIILLFLLLKKKDGDKNKRDTKEKQH